MKKLIILLLLLATPCWAVEPINLARSNQGVVGSGGAAAADPAWGGENTYGTQTTDVNQVITVASPGISAGKRAVIVMVWQNVGNAVTGVTDSRSNTWAVDKSYSNTSWGQKLYVISSVLGTGLQAGDTITLAHTGNLYSIRIWSLQYVGNVSVGVDSSAATDSYGTTASCTTSVVVAPSVMVGLLVTEGASTVTAGTSASGGDCATGKWLYMNVSATGSTSITATQSSGSWDAICVVYK